MKKIIFITFFLTMFFQILYADFSNRINANPDYLLQNDKNPLASFEEVNQKISMLPEAVRKTILNNGDRIYGLSTSSLKAISSSSYSDYQTLGTRSSYDDINNDDLGNLKNLILAECISNNSKYIPKMEYFIQRFLDRKTWVMPAHIEKVQKGDLIDLGVVDIAEVLGWTIHLFENKLSKSIVEKVVNEMDKRVFQYYISNNMSWMGFTAGVQLGNWNPWCNYKVVLSMSLLDDKIRKSTQKAVLEKSNKSISKFIDQYSSEGYSVEGPVYWQQSILNLFKYEELLKIKGYPIALDKEFLDKSLQYIQNMYISGDYFVNFGDATPKVYFFPVDIYNASKRINNQKMISFALFLSKRNNVELKPTRGTITQALTTILNYKELTNTNGDPSFKRGIYYNNNQVVVARTYNNNKGFIFAAKGGNNGENHSHNDIGSFILYYQGYPVFIDLGVGTYSKEYFSTSRYTLMATQSQYHNVPRVNDLDQKHGKDFLSLNPKYNSDNNGMKFSLDLQKAYPRNSGVSSINRTFFVSYLKPEITITDSLVSGNSNGKLEQFLMCLSRPVINNKGEIMLTTENKSSIKLSYNKDKFKVTVEEIRVTDSEIQKNWEKNIIYRLHFESLKTNSRMNVSMITIKAL